MAQWYHLFSLLSVMCMSFGALYIVFNSDFNQVCDYSDTVDSCDERKTYKRTEVAWENKQLGVDWLVQAQELRNQSEKLKCDAEKDLLKDLQDLEKKEAERVVATCMSRFKACVAAGYTTTTPGPTETDCTACNRFCTMTNWANIDTSYAAAMGFTGICSDTVCPWMPECGVGMYIHEKCSMRGCSCDKVKCPATTTTPAAVTVSAVAPVTTVAAVVVTVAPVATTTYTGTTVTTTATTTTATTTTATTSTSTSTTIQTTTTTTTTATTTTATTSTSTTLTAKKTTVAPVVTTPPPVTTTVTSTTSTSTVDCFCDAGTAGVVIVGRPYKTFFSSPADQKWSQNTVKLMQGVTVKAETRLPLGGALTKGCKSYFSDRRNYFGPQQQTDAMAQEEARTNAYDLGCGYSGQFKVQCVKTGATCKLHVDISTCSPPTYTQALDACYTAPTTTTWPTGPTRPNVNDWLGVELLDFDIASMPPFYNITTQTTTPYPCCEVHVGSVCRPDINFDHPAVGKTDKGRWQPAPSYNRSVGYFPVVSCDQQAKSVPRMCPRVKIKQMNSAFQQWPHCLAVCSTASATKEFMQICNRTANPQLEVKEKAAHEKKIKHMKAKAKELETWTAERMTTVTEMKSVIDCFDDRLPRRYNSMSLPKMRSGFATMPLHNQCRLHQCKVTQCLQVKKPCKIPYVHEAPEVMCNVYRSDGDFTCVEKVDIMSNNPLSLGFGVAWMVIGAIFACAGVANYVRPRNPDGTQAEAESTAMVPI